VLKNINIKNNNEYIGFCVAKNESVVPKIIKQNKIIKLPTENQLSNNQTVLKEAGCTGLKLQIFLSIPFKK